MFQVRSPRSSRRSATAGGREMLPGLCRTGRSRRAPTRWSPFGTTGESPTLSHDEHMRVVELCIEAAGKRVPVIAGTGSNSTDEAVSLTRHAKEAGADAGARRAALLTTSRRRKGSTATSRPSTDAVDIPSSSTTCRRAPPST